MTKKSESNLIFYISILCVIVGGITRVLDCWFYPVPVRDSFVYEEIIQTWINTGSYPATEAIPPLGIYILKLPVALGFEIIKGGIIINVLLGLCVIILFIKISFMIIPSYFIALCSGLIVATHPTLVRYSCQMTREISFLFFISLACYSIFQYIKNNKTIYLVLSSFFVSAAFLCRHEAIEFYLIIPAIIFFFSRKRGIKVIIRRSIAFMAFSVLSIVFISFSIGVQPSFYSSYKDELMKDVKPNTQNQIKRVFNFIRSND